MENKLYKSKDDVVIEGICGGVAEHFGFNVKALRIIFIITGSIWLYIILWILMPSRNK
ncbi:MAG: PspC domain-containing protein [Cellulosilyticaceae bacterium]